MADESIQATAENLRADFLNATSTAERWKVLNRAIEWAVAASENTDHYRQKAQTGWIRHGERTISDGERIVRAGDVVQHPDYGDDPWAVLSVEEGTLVKIAPLRVDYALNTCSVSAEHLFK